MSEIGTRVGTRVGLRVGSALTLFDLTLSLSSLFANADWVVIGSNGTVRSVVDWKGFAVDGHVFDQSDIAKQCAAPATHSDYGGKLCLTFTGVEYYVSTRPVAAWKYWIDGSGIAFWFLHTPTAASTNVALALSTGAGNGLQIYWSGGSVTACNVDTYETTVVIHRVIGGYSANVATWLEYYYLEGAATESSLALKAGTPNTGNSSKAPSINNPQAPLTLGGESAGSNLAHFRWRSLIAMARVPTAAETSLMRQYLTADTRIAA